VIGYAGWGFDGLQDPSSIKYQTLAGYLTVEQIETLLADRLAVNRWLGQLIAAFPDKLFVLKQHPGDRGQFTELEGFEGQANVLLIQNEEKIEDVLNACDIWLDYMSTTCMEAWLVGRPTCTLMPHDTSFMRMGFERGSVVIREAEEALAAMQEFYANGRITQFDDAEQNRDRVVEEFIGWRDGLNSLRAAREIARLVEQAAERRPRPGHWREQAQNRLYHLARNTLVALDGDGFRGDRFTPQTVPAAERNYYPQIDAFVAVRLDLYQQVKVGAGPDYS
jgi:hypothetical protein